MTVQTPDPTDLTLGQGNGASWILRRRVPAALLHQCAKEGIHPILAQVLYARKFDTPEAMRAFVAGEDDALGEPLDMAGMAEAVERLCRAILAGETMRVYGDFDVDGVSSTALLVSVLRRLGGHVEPYIPDRFLEGYGLNVQALEGIREQGASLCIAVDCGVRSVAEVAHARTLGLDMIIVDHHSAPEELPPAVAVIDPKRADSRYAFRDLAGVGVTYQLCRALAFALRDTAPGSRLMASLDEYLDLVALGTVADIVPLVGENRNLTRWGLNRMRSAPRPGLLALMEQAGVHPKRVDSTDVAFRLAPRLNAAGRLEHAWAAYKLLMADDAEHARALAEELGRMNQQRQALLEAQVAEAVAQVGDQPLPAVLFIEGPDYHQGIVGLIASRLRERYYRPTLVLQRDEANGVARGSARSIEGFHITRALDACNRQYRQIHGEDLFEHYGGHEQAAGFTLVASRLPEFQEGLQACAQANLDEAALTPRLLVDAIVPLADITLEAVKALAQMEPFGKGNPEPLLASLDVEISRLERVGREGRHLRLIVRQDQTTLRCIAFSQGELASLLRPQDRIDLVYRPVLDYWREMAALQLSVVAIRRSRPN